MTAYLEPPDGQVLTGVSVRGDAGDVESFLEVTDQDSVAILHEFSGFLNRESLSRPLEELDALQPAAGQTIGMVSWRMFAADVEESFTGTWDPSLPGGTLRSVAQGDVDDRLVDLAAQVRDHGDPVMLRPNWEMNAPWMPWGAFEREEDGATPREGNAATDYVQAWQRAHIVWDGGDRDAIDARLQEAGLPPLRADAASVPPVDNVAWVWAPTDGPAQPLSAPHDTADYYPGDAFVDWVGIDWYQSGDEDFAYTASERPDGADPLSRVDDFYEEYAVGHGKPIVLSEWGVTDEERGAGDDPDWMADALAWMEDRPAVKAQVYFNRDAADANHRLEDFPRSAEVLREELANGDRWIAGEAAAGTGDGSPALAIGLVLGAVVVAVLALAAVVLTRRARRS